MIFWTILDENKGGINEMLGNNAISGAYFIYQFEFVAGGVIYLNEVLRKREMTGQNWGEVD